MAQLQLTLLGGFQARCGEAPPLSLSSRKAHALLAYLALPPGHPHPRDKLAALLWGELSEAEARASLRQALFTLRKALPPGFPPALLVDGATVALDPAAVDVDVRRFERLVAKGTPAALAQTAGLYQGDLLAGLVLKDAPHFEEWLLGERERLREMAQEGLAKLLAHQRRAGATDAAVQTALRLLTLDPLQEPTHRTLMRLYAELGRRGAALRQYQHCVAVLQRDLGLEPEAETKGLYGEILRQRGVPTMAVSLTDESTRPDVAPVETPIIGRHVELARLRRALGDAWAGGGHALAVLGEAGIGKSRLVAELAGEAARQRGRLLLGRSYESEQILPFAPWVEAFRTGGAVAPRELEGFGAAWRAELRRLFPESVDTGAQPGGEADQRRLFEAIAHLLGHLAAREPVLLVLEDLHWADEMSCRLLAYVGRRLEGRRVLAVVTAREEELAPATTLHQVLQEMRHEERLVELSLGPLSRPDTDTLVRVLTRAGGGEAATSRREEHVWRISEGNPFTVVEVVRALHNAPSPLADTLALPERVWEVVAGRLERLSASGRALIPVAAVIGRDFDFPLLWRAARLEETEAATAVEELVRRRVLYGAGERFDFTHHRLREVAYGQLLAPRRRLLHRQVARALEARHAGDLTAHYSALGYHCRQAEDWEHAVTYLRQAGVEAAKRAAHRDAATSFEQALEVLEHLTESRETLARALELRFDLRSSLFLLGEHDRIFAHLRQAEALAQSLRDRRGLARVLALMASHLWRAGDHAGALEAGQRARAIASELQDLPLRILATFHLAQTRYALGDYRAAVEDLSTNVAALTGDFASAHLGLPGPMSIVCRTYLAWALAELGAFGEARVRSDEAVRMAVALDRPTGLIDAHLAFGVVHLLRGDLEHAASALRDGLAVSDLGDHAIIQQASRACLAYVQALTGQTNEAISSLERIVAQASTMRNVGPARVITYLGEAYLLGERPADAARQASVAIALARDRGERGNQAWALRLAGEIALRDNLDGVAKTGDHFQRALELAGELGMRPLVAHCHLGLGKLYRAAGERARAQEHLTTAATLYRDMAMRFWRESAEAELGPL